jgi:hypothetical protein
MAKRVEALQGKHDIPVVELFPPEFIQRYTPYETFDAFLMAGGWLIGENGLGAIPLAQLDRHVAATTRFPDWTHMRLAAVREWADRNVADYS